MTALLLKPSQPQSAVEIFVIFSLLLVTPFLNPTQYPPEARPDSPVSALVPHSVLAVPPLHTNAGRRFYHPIPVILPGAMVQFRLGRGLW